jgi:hypothetical protein
MYAIVPTVLMTAVLAGIASIPAHLFARHLRTSKGLAQSPTWPFAVAIAAALTISFAIRPYALESYRQWYVDMRGDALMAQFEGDHPLYRTIREREPELYQQIRNAVLDGLKHNVSREELIIAARTPESEYLERTMHLVPDEQLIAIMRVTVDQAFALGATNPELCVDMLMGRPFGDIRPFIPDELEERELAAMEAFITAPKEPNRPILSEQEMMALGTEIVFAKSATTGIPVSDFASVIDGTLEPQKACVATAEFLDGVLELPPAQAGAYLRALNNAPAAGG